MTELVKLQAPEGFTDVSFGSQSYTVGEDRIVEVPKKPGRPANQPAKKAEPAEAVEPAEAEQAEAEQVAEPEKAE